MTIAVNPWVEAMHAYVPGEQPKEHDVVKLNTNEAPYPPPAAVVQAVIAEATAALFNKYPDPTCSALRAAIAERLGITPTEIVVGNGSDETLRMLVHAFTQPGDAIAMSSPTYVLYSTLAEMFGVEVINYPSAAPGYELPTDFINADVKILFLPNPNPPIGTFFSTEVLDQLAVARPDRLVVIDEAYVDFAPCDAMEVYRRHPNVVISRTFSKSYSLAGLRAGFAVLRPELAIALNKIKDSYNVNRLTQVAALAAWNSQEFYNEMVQRIKQDRIYLTEELLRRGFEIPESHGNFVFAKHAEAPRLYRELKQRRVLVRYFDTPELRNGLRITIGTRPELDRLLQELDALL